MKRILITLITLSLCGLVSSQAMPTDNCRKFPGKARGSDAMKYQVEADLLQGVWTVGHGDQLSEMLSFDASGRAVRHEAFADGQHFGTDQLRWSVQLINHEPVLTLVEEGGSTLESYQVDQTCDGVVLTDLTTGQRTEYAYSRPDRMRKLNRLSQLAGQWVNTQPDLMLRPICEDGRTVRIELAEVRYTFREDGTFAKLISSRKDPALRYAETGQWTVSADGKHLILHQQDESGEMISLFAPIKHLEMDEMVLGIPAASMGEHQVANLDADLFFNKN